MSVDPERLEAIDEELAKFAMATGTAAGALLEERADLLLLGAILALEEAGEAYEQAAGAYARSPEASLAPVERSHRAQVRAARARTVFDHAAAIVPDTARLVTLGRDLVEHRALLARIDAALRGFALEPEENAFELKKATRDRDATRDRIAEIVTALRALLAP